MSISPLALAAKKVIDAAFVNGPAYDLASVAAFALESACLLQDPETAAAREQAVETARAAVAVAESSVALMKREHAENARLRAELEKYVGKEPTVAEEMAYLNRCIDAVLDLCARAHGEGIVSGGMFTVSAVMKAATGGALEADALTRLLAPTQALREDEDPFHPCGCPKRHARHADGCPTYTPATGCGDGPDDWCGGCSACRCEPHTKGCVKASAPR
ncbi:hypothetical protein NC239_33845 [Streptomyces sp. G3]|uniref:hypothetical protein n=1 Tax=Streptomyces sp. G3 TaxID=690144 RepID=UPI0020302C61|nr:hypothetical protein [Streptomyces sp. G3]MCM1943196.1 hypothetical protein [Streptomyces sp. G3]